MMVFMRSFGLCLAVVLLASCRSPDSADPHAWNFTIAPLDTLVVSGASAGDWRAVPHSSARMTVNEDGNKIIAYEARQTTSSGSNGRRYQERIRLELGGTLFYEVLLGARERFQFGEPIRERLLTIHSYRLWTYSGITVAQKDVMYRRILNGDFYYLIAESTAQVCFVGDAVFDVIALTPPLRHLEVFVCRPRNSWTRDRLEKHVLDLLGQLRIDQPDNAPFAG